MSDTNLSPPMPFLNQGQQTSPWFTVANQFIPRNLHDVIRWSRYITLQSPTTSEVIRKYATYPITSFNYDSNDQEIISFYEKVAKKTKLKEFLQNVGFEFFTVGNAFVSIYFPHTRMLKCPSTGCGSEYAADKFPTAKYVRYSYEATCPKCGTRGKFEFKDLVNKDLDKVNLIIWSPENIVVNHNPITGQSDYYYQIPNNVIQKVRSGDRLFVDGTPKEFLDAIKNNQSFKFDNSRIFHLKNLNTGATVGGVSIPPLLSLFTLVFYQATLRKANEAIATEYLNPLRVIFPAGSQSVDPIASASLKNFVGNMEEAIKRHKVDKNYVLVAPTQVGYAPIGGEGRNLLVSQEIEQAEESILMALGVSKELLSGTTNWTSSDVGLRMLENMLTGYVGRLEDLLEWVTDNIAGYFDKTVVKTTLEPFKLLDDDTFKQQLGNLVNAGSVSESTMLGAFGINQRQEKEKIQEEAIRKARDEIKTAYEIEKAQYLQSLSSSDDFKKSDNFKDQLTEAQSLAEQALSYDDGARRSFLYKLKAENYGMYLMVSKLIEESLKTPERKEQVQAGAEAIAKDGQEQAQAQEGQ